MAVGYVLIAIYFISVVWVALDARKRDWSQRKRGAKTAAGQVIGVVLLWVVFFPAYLIQRRRVPLFAPKASAGPTGTKSCPDCAETVIDRALVCKHCGFRFDAAT